MNECTCAAAIAASEIRKATLAQHLRLFPVVQMTRIYGEIAVRPIFEEVPQQ